MTAPDELANATANAPPDTAPDAADALTSEKVRFIEGMGRYFEQLERS